MRDHLNVVWKATGKQPTQLAEAVECPPSVVHVWGYFVELSQMRAVAMEVSRISANDIKDFCWLNAVELLMWERKAIFKIDQEYLRNRSKQQSSK